MFCVLRFNKFTSNLNFSFEILFGKHRTIDYVSIGSGKKTADMFLKVRTNEFMLRDFAKHA